MKCSKCFRYSRKLGRCLDGKIMPRTITGGVESAKLMGISYICGYSPLREKIKERMIAAQAQGVSL